MKEEVLALLKRRLGGCRGRVAPGTVNAAAVLVPLFRSDRGYEVLYTRRSEQVEHHPGEVSFPGGRYNPQVDRGLRDCALRETFEEIGLAPAEVEVLGALEPVYTVSSSFVITPYVGAIAYPHRITPNPAEVSEVFSVPLDALRAPQAWEREVWEFAGSRVPIETFRWDGHVIWGATQRITRSLLNLIDWETGEIGGQPA